MNLKIAIFTEVFFPKIDGITNRLTNTVRELKQLGHEVVVFAPNKTVKEFEGVRVVGIKSFKFRPYPGVNLSYPSPKIFWELQKFRPDLVHAVGPAVTGLWGTICAKLLGMPIVSSYHTDFPTYAKKYGFKAVEPLVWTLVRWIHNRAVLNLCPSQQTSSELRKHGIKNVRIWRGGVNGDLFNPNKRCEQKRKQLTQGHPQDPLAIYVGRLGFEKGLDKIKPLLKSIPKLRFALVGDGPARSELEASLPKDRVTFTGFQRGVDLAQAYASADIFFMPSQSETLGFVTMEAICSGLPVVGADAGGTKGIIQHGSNGFLYDPSKFETAIGYFKDLIEQPELRKSITRYGMRQASNFSWMQETKGLVQHYTEAFRGVKSHVTDKPNKVTQVSYP